MIRQMKGLMYYYVTDSKRNLTIFWSILLSTLIAAVFLAYFFLKTDDPQMMFSIPTALYIFCAIFGFVIAKHKVDFTIKMGAVRKNIFISFFIFFLGLSLFNAVAVSTVHGLISYALETFSIDSYVLMHPADLLTNTWLSRVITDTSIFFVILTSFYLFGLIFYRYGLIGGSLVAAIIVITLLFLIAKGVLIDFIKDIYVSLDMMLFYQIFGIGIIMYGLTWFLIRKITIVKAS